MISIHSPNMISKTLLLLLTTGALGANLPRGACNADNCARAITGTHYNSAVQASHTADCSSFLAVTVTPAAPTTTTTIIGTSYSVIGSNAKRTAAPIPIPKITGLEARQDGENFASLFVYNPTILNATAATVTAATVTARAVAPRQATTYPDLVPIYASACSGTVRYSSACSCAGITASTTYAPTPATVTSTEYGAPSIIPVCDPNDNYGVKYYGGIIDAAGVAANVNFDITVQDDFTGGQTCCAACFQEGSGCFLYQLYEYHCFLVSESQGTLVPTDYCPYGVYGIDGTGQDFNFYGVGPCGVIDPQ